MNRNWSRQPAACQGSPPRIVIAGGSTAGHVTIGLAIADAFRCARPDADILFIGAHHGMECRLVPEAGYRLRTVAASPIAGATLIGKARGIMHAFAATRQARRVLREHGTDLVVGVGGYVSAGGVLAAWTRRVPTVIHEANVGAGVANRVMGRIVDRVYLGWATTRDAFAASKVRLVGNPLRAGIGARQASAPIAGQAARVLVLGGSRGSGVLNERVPDLLERVGALEANFAVTHQCGGDADAGALRAAYAQRSIDAEVVPFIDDIAGAYAGAHIAISSAGAVTMSELAASGLPAVLVPLPEATGDHQTPNARMFAEATGGPWSGTVDWAPDGLARRTASMMQDAEAWKVCAERVRALHRPHAAEALAEDCLKMFDGADDPDTETHSRTGSTMR